MFHPGCFDAGHSLSNTEQWTNWELKGEDPAVAGQGPVNHLRVLQAIDATMKPMNTIYIMKAINMNTRVN